MANRMNADMIKDEIEHLCNMFDENGEFFSDDFKNELFNDAMKEHSHNDVVSIIAKIECGASVDSAIQSIFIEED